MLKQYQIRPSKRNRSKSPSTLIRSPAFMKKSEDDIPKINHKAIPLHHTYFAQRSQNNNLTDTPENDWQFWGCINPQQYLPEKKKCGSLETKRKTFSLSENLLRKYIKRRPSLTCVKRSYDFESEQQVKTSETKIYIDNERVTKYKQKLYTPNSNRSKKTNTTLGTQGEQQIIQLANNLALALKKTQIQPTNHHARRYINILQRKKRKSECGFSNKNQYD